LNTYITTAVRSWLVRKKYITLLYIDREKWRQREHDFMAKEDNREKLRVVYEKQKKMDELRRAEEARKREQEAQRERGRLEQLRKEAEARRERELELLKKQQQRQLEEGEEKKRQQLLAEQQKADLERLQLEEDLQKKEEMKQKEEAARIAPEENEEQDKLLLAYERQTVKLSEGVDVEIPHATPQSVAAETQSVSHIQPPGLDSSDTKDVTDKKVATPNTPTKQAQNLIQKPKATARGRSSTLGSIDPVYFTLRGRSSKQTSGETTPPAKKDKNAVLRQAINGSRGTHFWMGKEADFEADAGNTAMSPTPTTRSPKKTKWGFATLRGRSSSTRYFSIT